MDNAPEKISAFEKRIKRQVIGKPHRFLAVVPLGFEQTFVDELDCLRRKTWFGRLANQDERRKLESGDESAESFDIKITGDGKVEFTAKLVEAWKIAAYSRIANRIQMHIADFKAENFRDLERKAAEIPWELYLLDERRKTKDERHVHIHVTCKHSRLYHSDAVAERLQTVIEAGSAPTPRHPELDSGSDHLPIPECHSDEGQNRLPSPEQNIFVTLIDDRCTIWLDLAGEELYKRGHERFVNDAPLKETIAAAMLFESTKIADAPVALFDLMAGSGTFSLEAAYIANRLIPGVCRDFALKHQPAFKEPTWRFILDERRGSTDSADSAGSSTGSSTGSPTETKDERDDVFDERVVKIVTSDISEKAVGIIKHNVESAPLPAGTIDPQVRDFFSYTAKEIADACPGETSPVILLNPPYGKRLDVDAPALYKRLGRRLAELARALDSLGKKLTVGILAPRDIPASKYTCTANLLRECPALDPHRNPNVKFVVTSHGGLTLNAIFATI